MAYLTESGKQLAKEALFKLVLEDDSWVLPELLGSYIGKQISLLGCTNNPQSLNAVYVVINNIVSEFNELRTFRTNSATNMAKAFVQRRYDAFFKGLPMHFDGSVSSGDDSNYCIEVLSRKNTREVINEVFETLNRVIQASGITVIIHNNVDDVQPTPAKPAEEAQPAA